MTTYIEYELANGESILIEVDDRSDGIVQANSKVGAIAKKKAKLKFTDALKEVKNQANILIREIEGLNIEHAEIKFGVKTVGEAGNIAIGKVGIDVNYEITLHWTNNNQG